MVRSKIKDKKENPDFKAKRVKVGKKAPKPDSYTNTQLKFKRIRQVENNLSNLDAALHACSNTSQSIRKDGQKQLLGILKSEKYAVGSGQQILQVIFKGLNDAEKAVYELAGDCFEAIASLDIMKQHLNYYRLNMKLQLNNNFMLNRQQLMKSITDQHLQYLTVDYTVDFIPSLQDPKSREKAISCIQYLLTNRQYIQQLSQEDFFSVQQNFNAGNSQIELVNFIHSQIMSLSYLRILYLIKQSFPTLTDYSQLTTFPQFDPEPVLQFKLNVYALLLTECVQFERINHFNFESDFNLQKIISKIDGVEVTKPVVEQVNAHAFIQAEFEQLSDHKDVLEELKLLLEHQILKSQFIGNLQNKIDLVLKTDVFPAQIYLNELCKSVLRNDQNQQILSHKVFQKINEHEWDGEINADKFNQVEVNGKVVSCRRLLHKRFQDDGVIVALGARLE
ncbi:Conserved_hypothetical protein [Hexamita inflata]|uniref:Uncharacterized protein n=1 Tax=Hexamita inflata TaxID=28002 RepID=A0AA86PX63_9EUKA|nr:Conserved hypothetical protein [Hexamita inflata]